MFEDTVDSIDLNGETTTQHMLGEDGKIYYASEDNGHTHKYVVDKKGNGVAYKVTHPGSTKIFHQHDIVNWVVLDSQSTCWPECKNKYGFSGDSTHSHLLQKSTTSIVSVSDTTGKEKKYGATHIIQTAPSAYQVPLLRAPISTPKAVMGMVDGGIAVQVVREWVNEDYSEIKMVDPGPQNKYAAFQRPGARDRFFYIRRDQLVPFESIKPRLLKKMYVKPEKMSELERVAVPNWVKNGNVPFYHRGDAEYWVTVKTAYTCTGEKDIEVIKQEALLKGLEQLFKYYNVWYDKKTISDFKNGFLSSFVHDYHLESRPGSKLKMLVKVRAIYFDWIRHNFPKLNSIDVNSLPYAAKKLVLNPKRYESELEKMSKLMAKLHSDMKREGAAVPGVNLMKEAQRLQSFGPNLRKLLVANGIDPDNAEQKDYEIEIGYNENMEPLYVVARNVKQ